MKGDVLVEQARRAIHAVFGDRSVDKEKTRERLEELQELIESSLEALE